MPLVSVLLAVHNDSRFLGQAVESVLAPDRRRPRARSSSTTLPRTRRRGCLGSRRPAPSRAHERRAGRDWPPRSTDGLTEAKRTLLSPVSTPTTLPLPERLARQLERMERDGADPAVVGSAVLDLDAAGRPGTLHRNPPGAMGIRWLTLFGSPVLPPDGAGGSRPRRPRSAALRPVVRRERGLRAVGPAAVAAARVRTSPSRSCSSGCIPGRPPLRRGGLQESFQREIALREIGRASHLPLDDRAGRARVRASAAAGRSHATPPTRISHCWGRSRITTASTRKCAPLLRECSLRRARRAKALELGVSQPARLALRRASRRLQTRRAHDRASSWLTALDGPRAADTRRGDLPGRRIAIALLDRVARSARSRSHRDLRGRDRRQPNVVGGASSIRRSSCEDGASPGAHGVLRHDYPVTPGIGRALARSNPDVVVISGWSTFPSQGGDRVVAGAPGPVRPARGEPRPRPARVVASRREGLRRAEDRAQGCQRARGRNGRAQSRSSTARAQPAAVRIFANTVDVDAWGERALRLQMKRDELRADAGLGPDDLVVLSVARLVPEKGLGTLIRAAAGDRRQYGFASSSPAAVLARSN